MNITNKLQSKYWKSKNLRQVESYWSSGPANLRSNWFANQLKNYKFESIFEIGTFSGRNLKHIGDMFDNVKLGGLDVSPVAIEFAKNKLPKADFFCKDLYDISSLSFSYDIVFTSGTLIHIVPNDIGGIIKSIVPFANKYIMHIEQIGNDELIAGPKHMSPKYKESDQCQWNPDLIKTYNDLGYTVDIIPLPDDCKTNGAAELLIIKL